VAIDRPEEALRSLWQPWAVLEIDGHGYAYLAGTPAEVEQQATALGGPAREGHHWPDPLVGQTVIALRVPSPQTRAAVSRLPDGVAYRAAFGVGEVVAGLENPDLGRLAALRRWAEQAGGSLVLLAAPAALYDELDPWGSAPPSLRLQQRVKAAFDPAGVMVPGRLPGGL
jgi:FAD/FMN-containing dehydrogenase